MIVLTKKEIKSFKLTTFFNEIKTQFSTFIRVLRADNALEYVKNNVSIFCSKNGIIHQTSCSQTSQQNKIVERKYRHILHVARTIMFHMHVLKYLWSDVVLSACHLINRMPSSVLSEKFHSLASTLTKVSSP